MSIEQAIEVIKLHNRWRRGEEIEPESPFIIGLALDTIIKYYETTRPPQTTQTR